MHVGQRYAVLIHHITAVQVPLPATRSGLNLSGNHKTCRNQKAFIFRFHSTLFFVFGAKRITERQGSDNGRHVSLSGPGIGNIGAIL
jgi:hypothetical protein